VVLVPVAESAGSLVEHNQLLNTCSDQHDAISVNKPDKGDNGGAEMCDLVVQARLTFWAGRNGGKFSLGSLLEFLGLDEVSKDDAPLIGLALCPFYFLWHVDVFHAHFLLGESLDPRHFPSIFESVFVREGIRGLWALVIMEDQP
jgi:hypothetical protein